MIKRLKSHRMISAALLIAAAALLLRIAARSIPGFADRYRSLITRPAIQTFGRISDLVPFSLVEVLILLIAVGVVLSLMRLLVKLIKKQPVKTDLHTGCSVLLLLASIIFLLYEGGEDAYFFCTPFSAVYEIGNGSYTTEELSEVCKMLAERCNEEAPFVSRSPQGIMVNEPSLSARSAERMTALGQRYPLLSGWYPSPKPLHFSILMSKANMTGIYSAYTKEANYNRLMPPYNAAFTMCHELSHLNGVLPENEANFVAYLACRDASDHDIAYSGAMMGWVYCGNELYRRDFDAWQEIALTLDDSVNLDLNYNSWYWDQYKGKPAEAAQKFNDAYLKQAGQSAGVETYNQVVDLIVSYERSRYSVISS